MHVTDTGPSIVILRNMRIGCHIINYFIACILFADDVTLIAPTRGALQKMINACAAYCSKYCLKFNVGKTKVMMFGKLTKSSSSLAKIVVNGEPVEYIATCRYLGFYITSSTSFKLSTSEDLREFFGSVNSVLSSVQRPKENVLSIDASPFCQLCTEVDLRCCREAAQC